MRSSLFIMHCIQLPETSKENTKIADRMESLRYLSKTVRSFVVLLVEIRNRSISQSLNLSPHFNLFDSMIASYDQVHDAIKALFAEAEEHDNNVELVSREGFKYLLMSDTIDRSFKKVVKLIL